MSGPNLYAVRCAAQRVADEHSEALAAGTLSLKQVAEKIESTVIKQFGGGLYIAAVRDVFIPQALAKQRLTREALRAAL